MGREVLIAIFTTISVSGFSQIVLSGKVAREDDKPPISFVNIGILDSDVGSISEADGSFSISIPTKHQKTDLVRITLTNSNDCQLHRSRFPQHP